GELETGEPEAEEAEAEESEAGELGAGESETDAPIVDDSEVENLRTQDIDPNATLGEADSESKFEAMFGDTIAGRRLEDAAVREPEGPGVVPPLSLPVAKSNSGANSGAGAEVQTPAGDHAGDTV